MITGKTRAPDSARPHIRANRVAACLSTPEPAGCPRRRRRARTGGGPPPPSPPAGSAVRCARQTGPSTGLEVLRRPRDRGGRRLRRPAGTPCTRSPVGPESRRGGRRLHLRVGQAVATLYPTDVPHLHHALGTVVDVTEDQLERLPPRVVAASGERGGHQLDRGEPLLDAAGGIGDRRVQGVDRPHVEHGVLDRGSRWPRRTAGQDQRAALPDPDAGDGEAAAAARDRDLDLPGRAGGESVQVGGAGEAHPATPTRAKHRGRGPHQPRDLAGVHEQDTAVQPDPPPRPHPPVDAGLGESAGQGLARRHDAVLARGEGAQVHRPSVDPSAGVPLPSSTGLGARAFVRDFHR